MSQPAAGPAGPWDTWLAPLMRLLRLSVEAMVFAPVLPQLGIALAVLGAAAYWLSRRPGEPPRRALRELVVLYGAPPALLAWGHAFAGSLEQVEDAWRWEALGIYALLAGQLLTAVLLLARHRARLGAAALLAAGAMWWAAGASLVAVMAVYNDWL